MICLISALAFHGLTTQIPHAVDVALARGSERPRLEHPPVNLHCRVERVIRPGGHHHVHFMNGCRPEDGDVAMPEVALALLGAAR